MKFSTVKFNQKFIIRAAGLSEAQLAFSDGDAGSETDPSACLSALKRVDCLVCRLSSRAEQSSPCLATSAGRNQTH